MSGRAIVVVLLGAGCSGGGGAPGACPTAPVCLPGSTDRVFALEVVPRSSDPWARQEVAHVLFDDQWVARISLRPVVPLSGRVTDGSSGVAATVSATRPSGIAGLPSVSRSVPAAYNTGAFSIPLSDGSYTLQAVLDEASQVRLPPRAIPVDVRPGAAAVSVELAVYPTPLTGKVLTAVNKGVNGFRVRAVDPVTGSTISSVATSGIVLGPGGPPDPTGYFSLALSPAALGSPVTVIAEAPAPDDKNPARQPTLSRSVDWPAIMRRDSVDLVLPGLGSPKAVGLKIRGQGSSSRQGPPLPGSQVEVTADMTDPNDKTGVRAEYASTLLVTDPQLGALDLTLFPHTYGVAVLPPDDSGFARTSFRLVVSDTQGFMGAPELEARPTLSGQVVTAGGQPIAGAIVSTLLAVDGPDPGPLGAPLPQTLTDGDGRFQLRLQPGRYALDVAPPGRSPAARWTFDGHDVAGDISLPAPLTLPVPVAAQVLVVDPDGKPAAGVAVRLYDVTCPPMLSCPVPRLRADTVTGADGVAALSLGIAAP